MYYWVFVGIWLHYRLIAVELIRQEVLGADPGAIQKTEFVRQLKKLNHNGNVTENDQS